MSSSAVSAIDVKHSASANFGAVARRLLDVVEKLVLLTCYAYFLVPIVDAVWIHGDLAAVLLAVSESLVIALVFFRKPAQVLSARPLDWALAFGGTLAPTLVRPLSGPSTFFTNAMVLLMISGICFQIVSKYMLGRRFGIVAANRGICDQGPYRFVRHPIYMGYLLTHIGFLCISPTMWNVTMYALTYALMIPRMFVEERLLRKDPEYVAYAERVRSRLIPGIL
jgi:protein-S-isoprenylcysteine O-methyltransferase Ste14